MYGGPLQVHYLIRELYKYNIESVLICSKSSNLAEITKPFCKIIELEMRGDFDLRLLFQIIKLSRIENPNLIHLHSRRISEYIGGLAAKVNKIPSILTRRVDNKENIFVSKLKYRLYDHIVTISSAIKIILIEQGVEEKKLSCIKSAVDHNLFDINVNKQKFRNLLKLSHDSFLIGMIAQFIDRKGHSFLIKNIKEFLLEYKNVHVVFYGQGPLLNEMKKLVNNLNLQNQIHFMGFVSNLHQHLAGLDLVVHPAEKEGMGVSLMQSLSAGVPVVANNVGGIPEIIKNSRNGLLIPVRDGKALKNALKELLSNSTLREKLGIQGKSMMKLEFSINSMARNYIDLYKKLIN